MNRGCTGSEPIEEEWQIDAVIVRFDRTLVYRKLQIAFDAIRVGARFFTTNPDRLCPVPGSGETECASISLDAGAREKKRSA